MFPVGGHFLRHPITTRSPHEQPVLAEHGADAAPQPIPPACPWQTPRGRPARGSSGIIFVNRNGLRWRDAPSAYGSHKTLCTRWYRWCRKGMFARMLLVLAQPGQDRDVLMLDTTFLKTRRTAASLRTRMGLKAAAT